ncbi:MAG: PEGA domain-containing protein [Phycisphaerales bacterium]|nr:PEGA domain-containing protein [Phycisphaerales bacterium]
MSLIDRPQLLPTLVCCAVFTLPGCVRRTIHISTEPAGALVWLNGREVGRTPVDVDFKHYGTYDLLLKKKGWEPIIDARRAPVPVLDTPGLDFIVEIMPGDTHHVVHWHIPMVPRDASRADLMDRADTLRDALLSDSDASVPLPLDETP